MKTALEIYTSSDRHLIHAYYEALQATGYKGELAMLLLRAQKTQARVQRAQINPPKDGDYLRLLLNRNEWAIAELLKFCLAHRSQLPITLRDFKYGIRIRILRHASLRFRSAGAPGKWTGDEKNLDPICAYCDELMSTEYGSTGRLFTGNTAK